MIPGLCSCSFPSQELLNTFGILLILAILRKDQKPSSGLSIPVKLRKMGRMTPTSDDHSYSFHQAASLVSVSPVSHWRESELSAGNLVRLSSISPGSLARVEGTGMIQLKEVDTSTSIIHIPQLSFHIFLQLCHLENCVCVCVCVCVYY